MAPPAHAPAPSAATSMAILNPSSYHTESNQPTSNDHQQNLFISDVLDFGDIEKSLAKKLTDDDLRSALTCMNARDHVKTLKLSGCVNIAGCGLEPLR